MIVLLILAVQAALGLVFDPRYRDFPFAPLSGAAVPLLLTTTETLRLRAWKPVAERVAAWSLAISAVYIVFNETLANWQALWFCAGLIALALTLLRVRDGPG
jgi:glucan 1,3-beta-glucosidase